MTDQRQEKAARAIHETYMGKGSWSAASPAERSKARQALRVALAAAGASAPTPVRAAISRW